MVLPSLKGMLINFLLATSLAFLIASGTCLAFACAIPILPAWFPTTTNAHNVIRATMKALLKQTSPKQISSIRNKKISEIIEKRG